MAGLQVQDIDDKGNVLSTDDYPDAFSSTVGENGQLTVWDSDTKVLAVYADRCWAKVTRLDPQPAAAPTPVVGGNAGAVNTGTSPGLTVVAEPPASPPDPGTTAPSTDQEAAPVDAGSPGAEPGSGLDPSQPPSSPTSGPPPDPTTTPDSSPSPTPESTGSSPSSETSPTEVASPPPADPASDFPEGTIVQPAT